VPGPVAFDDMRNPIQNIYIKRVEKKKLFGYDKRVSDDRSNTNACWKNSSPQKYRKYGFSAQRSHVGKVVSVFEDREPRQQPRRQWRLPRTCPPENANRSPAPASLAGLPSLARLHRKIPRSISSSENNHGSAIRGNLLN
jgi:hypothetical protein